MSEIKDLKREIFICECGDIEHQYSFWYDEEDNELWFEPHLVIHPWYRRIWIGIKYIFGYKTKYGSWDSIILNNDDLPRLKEFLTKALSVNTIITKEYENQEKKSNIRN